jgi:hypothetical protein
LAVISLSTTDRDHPGFPLQMVLTMTNTLLATDRLQSPLLMRQAEKPTGSFWISNEYCYRHI